MSAKQIMLVAGEASGDVHAAELVKSLYKLSPQLKIFGMGGSKMRAEGVETVVDSEKDASVMGFVEVVGSLGKIRRAFKTLVKTALERKPDLIVLLDYPEFNLLLARRLKQKGFKVMYYICPQIWAWRKGRVKKIKRDIAKVAAIFPFEKEFYKANGVDVEYVGHPFIDRDKVSTTKERFFSVHNLDPDLKTVALLPGSRSGEVGRLLSDMTSAAIALRKKFEELQFVLPVADTLELSSIEKELSVSGADFIKCFEGHSREALAFSDVAVVASGTATLEAALEKIPFVTIYRLSPISYSLARVLVKGVKFIAMPNLIAEKEVVRELIQGDVNTDSISTEVQRLLYDATYRAEVRQGLDLVYQKLKSSMDGDQTLVTDKAARIALELVDG